MTDFPVIGLVGKQASGKTVVASELTDDETERIRMGDIVWDEVKRRGLELNGENAGRIANELRKNEGMDAIAKRCIPLIREKGEEGKTVIVDGIRGITEVNKFREEFKEDFYLVAVEASQKTRYERIKERKREDDVESFDDFKKKEQRELNWGLEEAINSADCRITNEGTIDDLTERVSKSFNEIRSKYER